MNPLYLLVLAAPLSLAARVAGLDALPVWVLAALAIAGLSELLGDAVNDVAVHTGQALGGVLATLLASGPELIIAAIALRMGMVSLVQASIAGIILINLLLVLGLSLLLGGLRHRRQYFNREEAGIGSTLLVLSLLALTIPVLYAQLVSAERDGGLLTLSEAMAAVLLLLFGLALYYGAVWDRDEQTLVAVHQRQASQGPVAALALGLFAIGTLAVCAYLFLDATPDVTASTGVSEPFVGFIVIPLIAQLSGHHGAIASAWENRPDVSLARVMGAAIQTMMYVAPLLVFASLLIGTPMLLAFPIVEWVAIAGAAAVLTLVAHDGRSNWLEGAILIAVWVMISLAFAWWPLLD